MVLSVVSSWLTGVANPLLSGCKYRRAARLRNACFRLSASRREAIVACRRESGKSGSSRVKTNTQKTDGDFCFITSNTNTVSILGLVHFVVIKSTNQKECQSAKSCYEAIHIPMVQPPVRYD